MAKARNIMTIRLQREVAEIVSKEELEATGIKVKPVNDNLTELRGEIRGPPDSPYAGGKFELSINIKDTYPFKPPDVRFVTKVWHPNVSSVTGVICLDLLKDEWRVTLTLRSVLMCIQNLLTCPEPKDPQDAVVARQSMENLPLFNMTAKFWTQEYAGAPGIKNADLEQRIAALKNKGINRQDAIRSLSNTDWNINNAIKNAKG